MSDLNKIECNNLLAALKDTDEAQGAKSQDPVINLDPLLIAYMEIYKSVQISHRTVEIEAKAMAINTQQQQVLIAREAGINFETLKWSQMFTQKNGLLQRKTVSQTDLEKMQANNEEVQAIREVISSEINGEVQANDMMGSKLNSDAGESQQLIQEAGTIAQMLTSLTNQIARI